MQVQPMLSSGGFCVPGSKFTSLLVLLHSDRSVLNFILQHVYSTIFEDAFFSQYILFGIFIVYEVVEVTCTHVWVFFNPVSLVYMSGFFFFFASTLLFLLLWLCNLSS